MSYPPTEADVISNDSLFSDSIEFDAAQKPVTEEDAAAERGLNHEHDDDDYDAAACEAIAAESPASAPPPPPVTNVFMKPRKMATKPPQQWVPVDLTVPKDDPEDEFEIRTAQKPVYLAGNGAVAKSRFLNGEPDIAGEVTNCFEEPGLLYRIVDRPNKLWAFYNDSRSFEVHVLCTFGKHSKIKPVENATMTVDESSGEFVVEVIVYPGETEPFIKGAVNGFASKLRALPLSTDYYKSRSEAQDAQVVQAEMDAIRAIVGDETDAERILQTCLAHDIPFVDLSFPPVQSSIDSGAAKSFKQLPWGRPSMYVRPELQDQIRLFRDGICPGDVEQGELGDCWLMCALATQAESPAAVMRMFRHPKGAEQARRERAIGAYRVSFNKNGLWRSVLVDDYLPVVAGVPTFAHSSDPCELWPAILEKAFAKMHGSYAMVQSGDPMHALTDMTGFPAMRIDEVFAEAAENNGRDIFPKMLNWHQKGYQCVLTTAGKAPAIMADMDNEPDFSDQPEMEEALAGTGFLPGHAYSVLDVKEFDRGLVRLLCVRNPWVYSKGWTQAWAWGSLEWGKHPDAAAACGYSTDKNDPTKVWMAIEDAVQYFSGGGVLFRQTAAHDARVPITFSDCKPGAVFQVSVKAPADVTFLLSNVDHRGMHFSDSNAEMADPSDMDYPAIMLSLAAPVPKEPDMYHVILNSSAEMTQPSDSAWLFLEAREIAMTCHLEPTDAPYLLIPRLMEGGEGMWAESNNGGTDMRDVVHPMHFLNDNSRLFPGAPNANAAEIAVTVGFETADPIGDNVAVAICKIDEGNAVFENFPKFPTDDVEPHEEELYFQVKVPSSGYAQDKAGTVLY